MLQLIAPTSVAQACWNSNDNLSCGGTYHVTLCFRVGKRTHRATVWEQETEKEQEEEGSTSHFTRV